MARIATASNTIIVNTSLLLYNNTLYSIVEHFREKYNLVGRGGGGGGRCVTTL